MASEPRRLFPSVQPKGLRSHTETNSVSRAYNPEFLCNPDPRRMDVMDPSRQHAAALRLFRK